MERVTSVLEMSPHKSPLQRSITMFIFPLSKKQSCSYLTIPSIFYLDKVGMIFDTQLCKEL